MGLGLQAGLGSGTALTRLHRFIEREHTLSAGSPVTLVTGNVPVSLPCHRLVTGGLLLAGDAARQVDPLTGGGILSAMAAGRLAAETAAQALASGRASAEALQPYQEQADRVLGQALARNYRLRQSFPVGKRADRSFVRLFAVAAGGK